jgi:hypothetical protein
MKQFSDEELTDYWRGALADVDAPDVIVSLNERIQRAREEIEEAEAELRDWARLELSKEQSS